MPAMEGMWTKPGCCGLSLKGSKEGFKKLTFKKDHYVYSG